MFIPDNSLIYSLGTHTAKEICGVQQQKAKRTIEKCKPEERGSTVPEPMELKGTHEGGHF